MRHFSFLTILGFVVIVSACTFSPTPGVITSVPTVSPTATTQLVTGVLPTLTTTETLVSATLTPVPATATVIARHPIPPNFPQATFEMNDSDGRWTITFGADGAFEVTLKGGVASRGTFDVIDDQLTLHDISGSKSCKTTQGDGIYKWTFDGKVIKLDGNSDKCAARAATLSGSIWMIQR